MTSEQDLFMSLSVQDFDRYYRSELSKGHALYRRMVLGPMSSYVDVRYSDQDQKCLMLGSNNYLGFANDPYIKKRVFAAIEEYGCGMSGPPLLNGHSYLHRELEKRLAAMKGLDDAILFPSGYQANLGILESVLQTGDVLIYDELSHASLIDGIKLSRATRRIKAFRFKHNDVDDLKEQLSRARKLTEIKGSIYVAVEGVYSMDGDLGPLLEMVHLCDSLGAKLLLDDAHGTGIMGTSGKGTCDYFGLCGRFFLVMGTFSKTFGMTGGFVCGSAELINYMRFFSRAYMFSAHLPIATVSAVLAGIELIEREPQRREACLKNALILQEMLDAQGYLFPKTQTPIIPIPIPEHISIRHFNKRLFEEGLFVNAVEYPAVPSNSQRLRLSVSSLHSEKDMAKAAEVFEKVGREIGMLNHE